MNLIQFKKYITKRNVILATFSLLMIIGLICSSTFSRYKSLEQLEAAAYLENFPFTTYNTTQSKMDGDF